MPVSKFHNSPPVNTTVMVEPGAPKFQHFPGTDPTNPCLPDDPTRAVVIEKTDDAHGGSYPTTHTATPFPSRT
jgi:hypothetical protein